MFPFLERSAMLVGPGALARLARARVLVVGAGGVGSYAIEALCRGGVGAITVVDGDGVALSNINRQLYALAGTVGCKKAELAAKRCAEINPEINMRAMCLMYGEDTAAEVFAGGFDYVLDAIDSVRAKAQLIAQAHALGIPIISALGTGNRLYPERLRVTVLRGTSGCGLARALRRELTHMGAPQLLDTRVVFSDEPPVRPHAGDGQQIRAPGSMAFVPPVAGMLMAAVALRELMGLEEVQVERLRP